jgi:hypothetical protein
MKVAPPSLLPLGTPSPSSAQKSGSSDFLALNENMPTRCSICVHLRHLWLKNPELPRHGKRLFKSAQSIERRRQDMAPLCVLRELGQREWMFISRPLELNGL